ncbi:hypothetical protein niasHT_014535 [Heterodera trifolii]|uniref:Rubicon Homology domain-containing protein n=1 Tax=Heterodera trifolii TaxID=157864 RepID=A0ABD2L3D7_9BILA
MMTSPLRRVSGLELLVCQQPTTTLPCVHLPETSSLRRNTAKRAKCSSAIGGRGQWRKEERRTSDGNDANPKRENCCQSHLNHKRGLKGGKTVQTELSGSHIFTNDKNHLPPVPFEYLSTSEKRVRNASTKYGVFIRVWPWCERNSLSNSNCAREIATSTKLSVCRMFFAHWIRKKPCAVCRAKMLTTAMKRLLIDFEKENPTMSKLVHKLDKIQKMRTNIMLMKCFFFVSCKFALKMRILQHLSRFQHFVENDPMLPMADLLQLANGCLLVDIEAVVTICIAYITEECEICRRIYPFSENVTICKSRCADYHHPCFDRATKRCQQFLPQKQRGKC